MSDGQAMAHKGSNSAGIFMLAAAIGAGIALLIAPKSGSETRADLMDKYARTKDKASDVTDKAKMKINSMVDKTKAKKDEMADDLMSESMMERNRAM